MNFVLFSGHLVNDMTLQQNQQGKDYTFGKIGVYQGKDQNGQPKPSMFFDFVCFGFDAKDLVNLAHKGDLITVCGRLEETTSIGNDGKTYVNKRIVCQSAKPCKKPEPVSTPTNIQNTNMNNSYDPSIWG